MSKMKILVLITTVVMMTACSDLKYYGNNSRAPVIDCGHSVSGWLAELYGTSAMPTEMLLHTRDTWEKEFQGYPSVNHRMRLVLLLTAGDDQVRDRSRALKLLQEMDYSMLDGGDQEFVKMLQQLLEAQDRMLSENNTLTQQVDEQEQRIDELQQQLQALTAIEQNIQQRDKSGGE